MQNIILLKLFQYLADLQTEINDFGVGELLVFQEAFGDRLCVRCEQIKRNAAFCGVVFNHGVYIVADAAKLEHILDKRCFFVDQIYVVAAVVFAFVVDVGEDCGDF